jgi:hypothetical protein
MRLYIVSILFLILISCSPNALIQHGNRDYFSGQWRGIKNKNSTLSIKKQKNDSYALKAQSQQSSWEGIGYQVYDKLICIFRYLDLPDNGYITFEVVSNKKLKYESLNPDGSLRFEGYYIR